MILSETRLAGVWLVDIERLEDDRGFFARAFCAETFTAHGLNPHLHQISLSFNRRAGTLRGLHLQRPPHGEAKLVRATAGAAFDVVVDLRPGSPTFGQWSGVVLSANSHRQIYIPEGFAHGFQTLTDHTELTYHISVPFAPASQAGVLWNDPDIGVDWPDPTGAILSQRDRIQPRLCDFPPLDAATANDL